MTRRSARPPGEGLLLAAGVPRPVRRRSRRARGPVAVVRPGIDGVHPAVAAAALERARGDATRIEVVSPTAVVVHNRPFGWS